MAEKTLDEQILEEEIKLQERQAAMGDPVVQEMHPDVSALDRFNIKNYAQSPEVGAKFLQEKFPNHLVRVQNGEIQLKAPNEKEFRVVDPDTGVLSNPMEMIRDVGDVFYDTASGIYSGAAGVLGGAAGNLPGGAAASGATSGVMEALRQKIGQQRGLPQEVSASDTALSAGLGAAGVGLFGTGAKIAGGGAKQAAQRGAIGRMWDSTSGVRDKVGSWSSGVKKSIIEYTKNNLDFLDEVSKHPQPVTKIAADAAADAVEKFNMVKDAAGKNIEAAVENAPQGTSVDVSPLREKTMALIEKLKKAQSKNPNVETYSPRIQAYQDILDNVLGGSTKVSQEEVPWGYGTKIVTTEVAPTPKVSVQEAYLDMKSKLEDLAQVKNMKNEEFSSRFGKNMTREDKKIAVFADKLRKELADKISKATGTETDNAIYNQAMKDQKTLNSWIKTPAQTEKKLSSMFGVASVPRETAMKFDQLYGTNLVDAAKKLASYRTFVEPNLSPLSSGGSTSTSRSVGSAALGTALGSGLGYMGGREFGDGAGGPAAIGGGLVGGAFGATVGGPQGLKLYMQAAKKSGKLDSAIRGMTPGGLPALYNKLFETKTKKKLKKEK